MTARILSQLDYQRGFIICDDCDRYAHVFNVAALRELPKGYSGELCKDCGALMVPVNLLTHKKQSA
jgi:hypothetical protein